MCKYTDFFSDCTIFATTKAAASKSTITAEHGTSTAADINSPVTEAASDIKADTTATGTKRLHHTSAVIIGSDIIDISSIMPTRRIVSTIQSATSTVMTKDTIFTGRPLTAAKSRSKATATMVRRFHAKNEASTSA